MLASPTIQAALTVTVDADIARIDFAKIATFFLPTPPTIEFHGDHLPASR
jgi:hypothetical protein